ncbi:MAG: ATP-binding protein [Bacteroidales bacterium]|nr:ATP-binding protein [Bacteroidales bacterium]
MSDTRRILANDFALKRDRALSEAERRKRNIYAKIPGLSNLANEISLAGVRYARSLINESSSEESTVLLDRMNRLSQAREDLLKDNNIPPDYLEPVFECSMCQDRGYLNREGSTVNCSCYQKVYLERLYQVSNLIDDGKTGFDFFDESFFANKPDKKKYSLDISPKEQLLAIKDYCQNYAKLFPESTPNLYFFGPTGTGKTFMAKSIGIELLKAGFSVLYLSATSLFPIIQQYRLNIDRNGVSSEQAYKNLITSNLLILDDLGTEPFSDSKYAELLTLLELRKAQDVNNVAKTIVSSNLDFKRLFQEYNERIASRIIGEFEPFQFIGEDIRILKKINNN